MPPDQVVQGRSRTAIGHEAGLHACLAGEKQTRHVRRRADAAMRLFDVAAVLFQIGDELAQVLGGEILLRDDDGWRMSGEADRLEVALGIVFHVGREHRSGDMGSHAAGEQRVAVGMRRCHPRASDRAAGAADILDHHGLAEDFAHLLRHDAGDDVARTAGREGHHHGDGPRRIALRPRVPRGGTQGQGREPEQSQRPRTSHGIPPAVVLRCGQSHRGASASITSDEIKAPVSRVSEPSSSPQADEPVTAVVDCQPHLETPDARMRGHDSRKSPRRRLRGESFTPPPPCAPPIRRVPSPPP